MDSGTGDAAVSRTSAVRAGWMGLLTGRAGRAVVAAGTGTGTMKLGGQWTDARRAMGRLLRCGPRRLPESSPPSPGRTSSASDHRAFRLSAGAALSRAGSVACCAAGFLAAFAALLALPLQAQAQTATTFVSNTGQTAATHVALLGYEMVQGFVTGDNTGGYTLESIEIDFSSLPTSSNASSLTVALWSADILDKPDSSVATLSNPSDLSTDSGTNIKKFTAPANTVLEAEAMYFVHFSSSVDTGVTVDRTHSPGEDADPASGWSINNQRWHRARGTTNHWSPSFYVARIRVNGTLVGGTTLSTDATLSDLELTDNNGAGITLTPTFAPARTSYTAAMANSVDEITIAPTVNDSNAVYEIQDSGGTALTDADSNTTGFQVALSEGANTIKVEVTGADNTTQTYQVMVTRLRRVTPPPAEITVPNDWSLIPAGLGAGDKFRLLFLSSTKTDGTSYEIADYNAFIQNLAASGHSAIQTYNPGFRAVGCTADSDARDNTGTTGAGVPIYWLNGAKAADNYGGFYDGSWDEEVNDKNELGNNGPDTSLPNNYPYTGCMHDGTESFFGHQSKGLGTLSIVVSVGRPNSSNVRHGPLSSSMGVGSTGTRPMYGLSQVFEVAATAGVTVSKSALTVTEQNTTGDTYTVVLNSQPTANVTVTVAGHAGTDVTPTPTTLTFTSTTWATTQTVTVTAGNDTNTANETVSLTHSAESTDTDYGGITIAGVTVTVTDVDSEVPGVPGVPTVTSASVTSVMAAWTAPANAGPAITDYDYRYRVTSPQGSWTEVTDTTITALSATITGLAEDTEYDVQVRATNDEGTSGWSDSGSGSTDAPDNTPATGRPTISGVAQVGKTLTALKGTIADADSTTKADNGDTGYAYSYQWLRVDGGTDSPITGATASTYTPVAADVGKTVKVTVDFTDDGGTGEARTSNAYPSSGTIVSETLPELSFAPNIVTVNEDAVSATLTVELDPASTGTVTVDYATRDGLVRPGKAGEDYTATSGTLTFAATETLKTITVPILNDDAYENNESFHVDLTNPTGATLLASGATVRIDSEDAVPTASMADVTVDEGAGTMTLTLRLSHPSDAEIAYFTIYDEDDDRGTATEGDDYDDFLQGPVRIAKITVPAGDLSQTFDITIVDDGVDEPDETIKIIWEKNINDEVTPSFFTFTGTITDNANAAPSFTSAATFDAAENQTAVGTVVASDGDTDDSVTGYTIQGGADRSKFSIVEATGVLTFASAPNFEAPADADTDNAYVVVVRAASGTGAREKTADQTITVTVTDEDSEVPGVPAVPTVSAASESSVMASWTAPATAGPAITDYDYRYRVKAPQGSWTEVTGTTITALSVTITGLAEDTEYEVQVRATNDEGTSGWSASGSGSTDANAAPSFTSAATFDAAENQTAVGTVVASDGDTDDSVTGYTIQGGADRSKFSIVEATGVLTFASAPNFEAPADADTDNAYVVVVRAASGTGAREKTADQTITVTVTDEDSEVPGVPAVPTVSAASESSVMASWTAPATAGPAITDYDYRYRVKAPQGSWTEVTGTTITALSVTITGLAEDTEYEVQVRATNDEGTSGWSASGSGSTDANAAPSFTSAATFDAAENQTAVGTVVASDGDTDDSVTGYTIQGGADRSKFSIVEATGVLTFASAPNFEAPADADTDNAYVVVVRAASGTGAREKTADQTITVTVTDEDSEVPGRTGRADGVGGVGEQRDGELDGARDRRAGDHGLRLPVPGEGAAGLVDGGDGHDDHGAERDDHGARGGHGVRSAGAGDERRRYERLVGVGQRLDGRGAAVLQHSRHR